MKRSILLFVIFVFNLYFSQSRTEDFSINIPDSKVSNSLYKTIKLYDVRVDSTNLGIVQKGAFNAKARVIPSVPLKIQFQNVLDAINNNPAATEELLLYLKQLSFAEVTGAFSETGYFYFQAILFSKNSEGYYQKLDDIDSVVVHSSLDVTKAIMRKGSALIADFIKKNINKKSFDKEVYTWSDLQNYDRIQKQKFPLYANDVLNEGIYKNFENFRNQKPLDTNISKVKFKNDQSTISRIYSNTGGNDVELPKEEYYALVYKGIPYLFSNIDNSFLKLEKREDGDFYYVGRAKTTAKTGNVVLASVFFGVIGGLIASEASSKFEMKLDYQNGGSIPIKEVKN